MYIHPQVGSSEEENETFWTDLQKEMEKVEDHERCIVGGDLNGHVGMASNTIGGVHGRTITEQEMEKEKELLILQYQMTL